METVQLLVPVPIEVAVLMVLTTASPLRSSILTYPVSPVLVQVTGCMVPGAQTSPPLGEVTVIDLDEVEVVGGLVPPMVKFPSLVSDFEPSLVLVIRILA